MPEGKSLHETMQENCNERLAPPVEPCPNPCVPYWQRTGNQRCLDIGVVEVEESDGCCNTRYTRIADQVIWTDTEETRCDEPRNRIERKQTNQCGNTRWVTTHELCCTPQWVPVPDEVNCMQTMERVLEEDGCGNTRLRSTGFPVNWVSTGEIRCEPGDIYQVEQTNQCGDLRWFTIPGGCPCMPDWQPSGPERCTGTYVEIQQVDGCGHTRWFVSATAVVWENTGETRCSGGLTQNQQISQCGTLRWHTTDIPCNTAPAPIELGVRENDRIINDGVNPTYFNVSLNASTGVVSWDHTGTLFASDRWVPVAFDRNAYEARITYTSDFPEDGSVGSTPGQMYRIRTSAPLDTWLDLGDTTDVFIKLSGYKIVDGMGHKDWSNINIRIDIRKKGEGISGGISFTAITVRR